MKDKKHEQRWGAYIDELNRVVGAGTFYIDECGGFEEHPYQLCCTMDPDKTTDLGGEVALNGGGLTWEEMDFALEILINTLRLLQGSSVRGAKAPLADQEQRHERDG